MKSLNNHLVKYILCFSCSISFWGFNQIQEGVILFERKTNLFKKYTEKSTQDYIKEENKYKIDQFSLYFNDSSSIFIPEESYENNRLSWTTNNNAVIHDFNKDISRVM